MKKHIWLLFVGAAAVVVAAQSGLLSGFAKQLNDAKSLKATYQAGTVSGAMSNYDVSLAKPNMARIETASQVIVADGAKIVTYDKGTKTYYSDPQNAGSLAGLLAPEALNIWAPFFDAKALDKVATKSLGQKTRRGASYNVVEATFSGGKRKVNYYLDAGGLARMAEIAYGDTNEQGLILTKTLELGTGVDASLFAFTPPAGSRELTEEERYSSKWYQNLDEGLAVAKKLNKLVMVDFNATWCGPCKRMKAEVFTTEEFKKYGKHFVFVEIDTDEQPALAQKYGASSIPNVHFLKADGTDFHQFVGYSNPQQVFGEMNKALQLAGR